MLHKNCWLGPRTAVKNLDDETWTSDTNKCSLFFFCQSLTEKNSYAQLQTQSLRKTDTILSSGLPRRETWRSWSGSSVGLWRWRGDWSNSLIEKAKGLGPAQPQEKKTEKEPHQCLSVSKGRVLDDRPGSALWCQAIRQEATEMMNSKLHLNMRKIFFAVMVMEHSKWMPREIVEFPSLERNCLDTVLSNIL